MARALTRSIGVICTSLLAITQVTVGLAGLCRAQTTPASIRSAPQSRILPPPPGYAFVDQKYVYSVQWHLFNAGTATVKIQATGSGAHVTATADSAGMPDKLFRIHNRFDADLNSRTFCTLQVTKHDEEGPRRREVNILIDYVHSKSKVDSRDLKTSQTAHSEFEIPPCVTDVISGFFYVASLPLAPGYSETFPVNDNGKTTYVRIQVEATDRIKLASGEFQTLRVRAEPLSGAMKGKGVLWVWFTDDARHAPVQMKSKLGFATLLFQLQKLDAPPGAR